MKENPLITVILPAFNACRFVQEAIDSVIRQSYVNWELIIINDGSTDNTDQIIRQNDDSRIRYFNKANGGVSSARNVGLEQMLGDYFCFLDADDVLPPHSLEARLRKFTENPDLEFIDGVVHTFDESLSRKIRTYRPRFRGSPLPHLFCLSDNCFFGSTWMIKRKSNHYFMDENLSHGEDYFFFLTLSRKGGLYDFVDEDILLYRKHGASAMQNIRGLHVGYKQIYSRLIKWPEFGTAYRLVYNLKMRKFIFLSYLSAKKYSKALAAVFS